MKSHFGFHAMLLVLVLISPLAHAATDSAAVTQIPPTECEVLVTLYNSTNGDSWTDNSGWLKTNKPCWWNGVTCSGGHVSRLSLRDNQLTGSIPSELGNLSNLSDLHLSDNELTGSIPSELGNLSNLSDLNLSDNELTGSIPSELGNLSNLRYLHLSSNELTGSIPSELGNLSNLRYLFLSFNDLTGTIPRELGNLNKLWWLNLHYNELTGTIPRELGNLSNLTQLWLHSNELTGTIPSELAKLSELEWLYLHNNRLCGEIPVEFKNLHSIKFPNNQSSFSPYLRLYNNKLIAYDAELIAWLDSRSPNWEATQTSCSGFFTTPIVKVAENANSVTLTVQRNGHGTLNYATIEGSARQGNDYIGATGTINWSDGDVKSFTITINNDNDSEINETFTIALTDSISGKNLDNVTIVIMDDEPADYTAVTQIPLTEYEILVTFYNSTNGDNWKNNSGWFETNTPCNWYGMSCNDGHISGFKLSSNELTGTIPTELANLSNLGALNLRGNQLTGSIPTELANLSNLGDLNLSYNQLTGSIPIELGNLTNLESLSLGDNQLSGSIPSELGNLTNLESLSLGDNQLSGSIPSELGNLTNLTGLYLRGNRLTDSIPSELGNLTNLTELDLPYNQLTGSIPIELGNLTNLESLSLGDNQLTGSIPIELGNLSNLTWLNLNSNQLTGSIPTELGNLTNLWNLWLMDNKLTGSIPTELSNLSMLRTLGLSGNELTGSIPSELGNLTNLEELYLSSNQLTGSIPRELGNLSSLRWFYLNNNQLCGEIPVELKNLSNIPLPDQWGDKLQLDNNHLTASDPELIAWLDEHNPGWQTTQTPCPIATLQFSSTTYSVIETGGQATFIVTRVGANNGAISANYATTDGTATAGSDYTQTTGTLSWADGDLADKTFTITIIDDGDSEGPETFIVTLTDPVSGENLDSAIITISDDDATFVTLADFTATANETGILLEWQTAIEVDNAGFHLWRATGEAWKSGDYSTVIRLTEQVIAAQGNSSVYSYRDTDVESGITYYYGLEDIDLYGQSTFHWDLIDVGTLSKVGDKSPTTNFGARR
ncbi:MAG: leucine-rich repeat domain-containing protein [Pseudomonadota bacterium]